MTRSIIIFCVFALFQLPTVAQSEKSRPSLASKDTIPQVKPGKDSVTAKKDTTKIKKGDIESTIVYSAEDSITSELSSKIVKLYGNAKVTYGSINLDAEEIIIDYNKSTITANGKRDSTGKMVGFPVFKDGNETYETKGMVYNFKTRKARISEVVTKQGEGFMHGERVFKNEKNDIFTIGNAYTTCDLADPHFRIISKRAKAIPGDKIVSGPFYMEFNHVPTPLGFAFGIFPSQRKSTSGIIVPAYGEEQIRGFFLRRGGYYFAISDYLNLSVTADLYSRGSTGLYLNSAYISRYKYSGSIAFSYNSNNYSQQIEKPDVRKDFSLTWSHAPRTKGTSRFAASVNAATSTNNSNNFLGVGQVNQTQLQNSNTQQKASSNVSFSKTFSGTPISLSSNFRHNQDFRSRRVDLSLPDISLNVNNIYPLKKSQSLFLQNLQFKYTMTASNQVTNYLGQIANKNGVLRDSVGVFDGAHLGLYFQNANKGVRHIIPISTSFKMMKFFTVTASGTYNELWYFDKIVWGNSSTSGLTKGTSPVKIGKIYQFNRESYYNLTLSVTTRIYGTYLSKNPSSRIRAIRHLITPVVGFTYSPDFSDPKYGYYQRLGLTDASTGKPYTVLKSVHEGYLYGTAPSGKSEAMTFSIGNSLEMKVRKPKDSIDRKVSLINNLSLGSSYNFLADSFKLAPISISANSNILDNKLNINIGASLDPYQYRHVRIGGSSEQVTYTTVRVNQYAWNAGKLGRITTASLALSTNLNPKGQKKDAQTRDRVAKSNAPQADKDYLLAHPDTYVDFTIPWNLRLSYNVNFSNSNPNTSPTITQSTTFSGDVSLSAKWKITYTAGYDFVRNTFTQTNLSLTRDLHCWQMSVNWVPFGKFQSYTFNIGIKSSLLKDLKLNRTRSFIDSQAGY